MNTQTNTRARYQVDSSDGCDVRARVVPWVFMFKTVRMLFEHPSNHPVSKDKSSLSKTSRVYQCKVSSEKICITTLKIYYISTSKPLINSIDSVRVPRKFYSATKNSRNPYMNI